MTVFVLDIHVLLWWLTGQPLTPAATAAIIDPSQDVYISVVTGWEIAIKSSQGNLTIDGDLTEEIYANGFDFLPVRWSHASQVGTLPSHHRDPFDRMLIAQCQSEGFTLISRNLEIAKYEVDLLVA